MMKFIVLLCLLIVFITLVSSKQNKTKVLDATAGQRSIAGVKIYSNLAEIIKPLGKLPLKFSYEDWNDIRSDSLTLVGNNVTVTQQTITEKKKSLNNAEVMIRSPFLPSTTIQYVVATLVDEKRNLVKLVNESIYKGQMFFTVPSDQIAYTEDPPQSKYYVNFTYDATGAVYVSYLRSNLNWKTSYQLNLLEDSKNQVLVAMADIRNDGQSKVDIEHAELLGGDINLQMNQQSYRHDHHKANAGQLKGRTAQGPIISEAEEVAGLYIFTINQPFSIDAKTNYLLPMYRPQVTVDRYGSISKSFYGSAGSSLGKAQRTYRLSSDRLLSRGNCIIRESERLVGETTLPDLAAQNKYEFSIGQDPDIVYTENATFISSHTYNITVSNTIQTQTNRTYKISLLLKNFKKNRPVTVEYTQRVHGDSIELIREDNDFSQEGSTIKYKTTIAPNSEKLLSYKVGIIN